MNVLHKKAPIVVGQADSCDVMGGDEGIVIKLHCARAGQELMAVLNVSEATQVMAALGASIVNLQAAEQRRGKAPVFRHGSDA